MREIDYCAECGETQDFDYVMGTQFTRCYCHKCNKETAIRTRYIATRMSPYERTRAAVYATGNRWAIENFNATH